jgi:N-acetylglutamate synthase-like GNAT family acetyltransferase
VNPGYQRIGVGRRLIERQVEAAKNYGSHSFRFTATDNLTDFYRKLGFTLIRKAESFHGLPQAVWEKSLLNGNMA